MALDTIDDVADDIELRGDASWEYHVTAVANVPTETSRDNNRAASERLLICGTLYHCLLSKQ